eukprot:5215992-Prymnesium_polylepis.1
MSGCPAPDTGDGPCADRDLNFKGVLTSLRHLRGLREHPAARRAVRWHDGQHLLLHAARQRPDLFAAAVLDTVGAAGQHD